MKNNFVLNRVNLFAWMFVIITFSGCSEYLNNPLIDKETGEDLNLLIIDFNFFSTSMTYKFIDAADGSLITQEANISFSGLNKNDIITFAGEKKDGFQTSMGQLELTIDPNVLISENTPFEFAINVNIDGYNSLSKGIQIQNEGKKTYELYLSKINNDEETDVIGDINFSLIKSAVQSSSSLLKSAGDEDKHYTISFSVNAADLLQFEDENGKMFLNIDEIKEAYNNSILESIPFIVFKLISSFDFVPGIELVNIDGVNRSVLFQILETGLVNRVLILGEEVVKLNDGKILISSNYTGDNLPAIFGFTEFESGSWNILGSEIVQDELKQSFTLANVIEDSVCETGGNISFHSNMISSFSIDADLYDLNNNYVTTMNFKGNFPETFLLENIPQMPLIAKFRNNNPAFAPIPSIEIEDFCSGNFEVEVSKSEDYIEYQIVLKALCEDNPDIAIAPTYNAEIRLKNSDDLWQGITMTGGVANVLGMQNQEYELRLLWDSEWEYSTYFTKFDADGNYLGPVEEGASVVSKILEDRRIQISVEKIFSQSICSDLI